MVRSLSIFAFTACLAWFCFALGRGEVVWLPAFSCVLAAWWAGSARHPGRLWRERPAVCVFLAGLTAYFSTFHWHGGDDLPSILLPFAVLRGHTLALDGYLDWLSGPNAWYVIEVGGRHLSFYPPGAGLMALPLYVIVWLFKPPVTAVLLRDLSKVSAALITAGSAAALWKALERRCSRRWALSLCALYGLGSWAFSVSSQGLWQHGPAQLATALGLWALCETGWRWDALAGLALSAAVAIRPDGVWFAVAAFAALLLQRRSRLPGFCLGAAVPAVLTAAYWLHYTGRLRPPDMGIQSAMFGSFQPQAFWALLASPTRGLLVFFPAALFGAWGTWRARRDALRPLMLAACAAQWLMLSFYDGWVGGNTFGTRYFAVTALVLTWLCADVEDEVRRSPRRIKAWRACLCYCVALHALGAYLRWPGPPSVAGQKAAAWDWKLYPPVAAVEGLIDTSRRKSYPVRPDEFRARLRVPAP